MALTSTQQAYKSALQSGNKSDIQRTESAAMRSGWESMSNRERQQLKGLSGTSWADSPASGWGGIEKEEYAVDPYAEIRAQQEALLAAQKQARINALQGQRQSAISALGYEESGVAPQYLQQRATLKTSGEQAARRAQEALAARGLGASGASAQGDIARNVALQQGMTSIGEAEASTLANIAQRKTQAEQAYASGVAQAESEAAATAAQNEIARLMQAQAAQEASVANQAQAQFEQQKMAQEQANKLQIEQLRIAADEAAASGDFQRAQELAKYKNDLEAETIKLRASIKPVSSGGSRSTSGGSTSDMTVSQRALAKSVESQIAQSPGSYRTILARATDPIVRAYLAQIYGNATTSGTAASPSEWNFAKAYAQSQGVQGY